MPAGFEGPLSTSGSPGAPSLAPGSAPSSSKGPLGKLSPKMQLAAAGGAVALLALVMSKRNGSVDPGTVDTTATDLYGELGPQLESLGTTLEGGFGNLSDQLDNLGEQIKPIEPNVPDEPPEVVPGPPGSRGPRGRDGKRGPRGPRGPRGGKGGKKNDGKGGGKNDGRRGGKKSESGVRRFGGPKDGRPIVRGTTRGPRTGGVRPTGPVTGPGGRPIAQPQTPGPRVGGIRPPIRTSPSGRTPIVKAGPTKAAAQTRAQVRQAAKPVNPPVKKK